MHSTSPLELASAARSDDSHQERRRAVHLVGSLPRGIAPDVGSGMRWVLDHAGDARLWSLPCDTDPDWIVDYLRTRADRAEAFDVVRSGDCSDYAGLPQYRVQRGHRLTEEDIALGRPAEVEAAIEAWRELGDELPPVQVSVPSSVDLSAFTLGPLRSWRWHGVFERMIAGEVACIARRYDAGRVAFQLESPTALYLLHRMPRVMHAVVAQVLARCFERIVGAAPDAPWTLHLCYGDLAHRALIVPTSLRPAVVIVNALEARLRGSGIPMPAVHIPMAYGDQSPLPGIAAYAPLRELSRRVEVIAGCVDELRPDRSALALRHAESALGRSVAGVAAACGHGRRTPTQARLNLELARRLAHDDPDATREK